MVSTQPTQLFNQMSMKHHPEDQPHIWNLPCSEEVKDCDQDLCGLIATCSAVYCLCTVQQKCRLGYPKSLQPETPLEDSVLLTARNVGFMNSFNLVQLCSWRSNVNAQYCVSPRWGIVYSVKYTTKCEPCFQPLNEIFATIVCNLIKESYPKALQMLLINSVGERKFTAQAIFLFSHKISLDEAWAVEKCLEVD